MKKIVVLGAGGFIGGHLVTKLKELGHWVRGVDIKWHEFKKTEADEFIIADLRKYESVNLVIDDTIDEVYQLAADMGGAEFVFSGVNDADILHNSAIINLHVCDICVKNKVKKVFYSSSACIYPEHNQLDPDNPNCEESSAYPADPDSEYGWEKLFSERLFLAYKKTKDLMLKLQDFIMFSVHSELGAVEGKKHPLQYAEKLLTQMAKLKFLEMEHKPVHFYI